jgi:hypothetical protein
VRRAGTSTDPARGPAYRERRRGIADCSSGFDERLRGARRIQAGAVG